MNRKLLNKGKKAKAQPPALTEIGQRLRAFKPGKSGCAVQELMRLTDFTRAQINNLEKTGLVVPTFREHSKSRTQRAAVFYSTQDVLKALIISDMRAAKFSLQQVRKAMKNLEELGFPLDASTYLLTDGYTIHVAKTDNEVVDVLRHYRQMLLLVSIEDQIQKLEKIA